MSGGFCGACGAAQPDPPTRFCSACGNPIGSAAPAPPAAPVHPQAPPRPPVAAPAPVPAPLPAPVAWGHPPPPGALGLGVADGGRAPRRRWPLVAAAALVVVVLVVGAIAATSVLRGGSATTTDGVLLPTAVTSEPEEAWSHDFSGDYVNSVLGVGDQVVMVDEDGEVVALDDAGEEQWTYDDHYIGYATTAGDRDDLVLVSGAEGGGSGALSASDGEELWWDDSGYVVSGTGDVVLMAESTDDESTYDLRRVDVTTGDEEWAVDDVGTVTATPDAVYVVDDRGLSRLDLESGDEEWSADLDVDDDEYAQVTGAGDLVAVTVGQQVTAFDPSGGEELWTWTADDSESSVSAGAFGDGRVYIEESLYDEDDGSTRADVTVRDRDGEVGEFSPGDDQYVYGIAVQAGGTGWFLDLASGNLYDDEVSRAASYDGALTAADEGVYSAGTDSVSFYEYGESRSSWKIDVSDDESRSVYAVDGALLVAADGTLTAYR